MSATMKPSPPLGLAFIAGALKREGHSIQVIDSLAEAPNQYIEFKNDIVLNGITEVQIAKLIHRDTKVIGLSLMFSGNWLHNRILIDYLGNCFPDAIIIGGGEHLTAAPEMCIEQTRHLKVCICGEGEETVTDVVKAIESGSNFLEIPGIVYRNEDNVAVRTKAKNRIKTVEELAWPAWELFPLEKYKKNSIIYGVDRDVYSVPLMATRGCPYECTFCSSPQMWGTRYFMRSPQDVVNEMDYFHEKFNVRNFDFYDLTAIIKKAWIIEFAQEVIKRKLDITWQIPAGTRSEVIDREVAHSLYASGCRNITYAPESGSVEILKLIKKKVSLSKMLQSITYSSQEKMNIKINVIIGFPGEKHKNIWQTMWFLIKASWHGVNDMAPSVFSPYPGSALFEMLQKQGRINMNNDDYFYQIIYVDTFFNNFFYNDDINKHVLRFYLLSYLAIFYISNFIFHPARLVKTVQNLWTSKYDSRAEMALGELIKRSKIKVKQRSEIPVESFAKTKLFVEQVPEKLPIF
ncbi:MAG: radical SAM protein [Chitinophagales bacterium]|nr:radical SAM protein [Chitinophagales bacterium]